MSIQEAGVHLELTIVDTPGFGDVVDNTNWLVGGDQGTMAPILFNVRSDACTCTCIFTCCMYVSFFCTGGQQ